MARNGCWEPLCEFTGTKLQSNANPGRCTKTAGYLAYAEIMEIMRGKPGVKMIHDHGSNTDVLLYDGDYVSYMTPTTKSTRREDWKKLNFAGSVDWALDLQTFTATDFDKELAPPKTGFGCILGEDNDAKTEELCGYSCNFGVCPETLCTCTDEGSLPQLPPVKMANVNDIVAWDTFDVDMNRLCKFACKYGYCPGDSCFKIERDEPSDTEGPSQGGGRNDKYFDRYDPEDMSLYDIRGQLDRQCIIYQNPRYRDRTMQKCLDICKTEVDAARAEGRTTNYGCVGLFPLDKPIPWDNQFYSDSGQVPGRCVCDHGLVNTLADLVIDAMPAIAQVLLSIFLSYLCLSRQL